MGLCFESCTLVRLDQDILLMKAMFGCDLKRAWRIEEEEAQNRGHAERP